MRPCRRHLSVSWRQLLDQPVHVVRDLAQQSSRIPPRCRVRNRDRVLVNVQSNVNLATLVHGRSPQQVLMTRSQHVALHACVHLRIGRRSTPASSGRRSAWTWRASTRPATCRPAPASSWPEPKCARVHVVAIAMQEDAASGGCQSLQLNFRYGSTAASGLGRVAMGSGR